MEENKDYRHHSTHSFAGHQVNVAKHKEENKYVAYVRHPQWHEIIHTTEPHESEQKAHHAAKQWVDLSSPQAYRSRRGGNLHKAEEDCIKEYSLKTRQTK